MEIYIDSNYTTQITNIYIYKHDEESGKRRYFIMGEEGNILSVQVDAGVAPIEGSGVFMRIPNTFWELLQTKLNDKRIIAQGDDIRTLVKKLDERQKESTIVSDDKNLLLLIDTQKQIILQLLNLMKLWQKPTNPSKRRSGKNTKSSGT